MKSDGDEGGVSVTLMGDEGKLLKKKKKERGEERGPAKYKRSSRT